jgi:integrase
MGTKTGPLAHLAHSRYPSGMARKRRKRNYGSGSIYPHGDGFRVQVRTSSGQRKTRAGIRTREEAEVALRELLALEPTKTAGGDDAPALATLYAQWSVRRRLTHRTWRDDDLRWNKHLAPVVGPLRPQEVTPAVVKAIVVAKRAEGLSGATARLIVRLLSTFLADLVDDGWLEVNPAKALPKAVKALLRLTYDPRSTPYLRSLKDVRKVYRALPEPFSVAFALGALAGLRTSEVRALRWSNVHLDRGVITVAESVSDHGVVTTPKNGKTRDVVIMDALAPVLRAWRKRHPGDGLVVEARGKYLRLNAMSAALQEALAAQKLQAPGLRWYQSTRHTFASLYVLAGGTLEALRDILGHSTIVVTERYAHLVPDRSATERARLKVAL